MPFVSASLLEATSGDAGAVADVRSDISTTVLSELAASPAAEPGSALWKTTTRSPSAAELAAMTGPDGRGRCATVGRSGVGRAESGGEGCARS